jgi:hypothetical protein
MRVFAPFASVILLCALAPPAISGGTIDIETIAFDNFIMIAITVVDSGGSGGCNGSFKLQRRAMPGCDTVDLASFARQPGTTTTHRVFDGPLQPSRAYHYEVIACSGFTWTFDCGWGLPIAVVAATTPAPTLLGHGRLSSGVSLQGCRDTCAGGDVLNLTPDAFQYIGTDTELLLYGSYVVSCQAGWLLDISHVVESACTVTVEPRTWSQAKRLFH